MFVLNICFYCVINNVRFKKYGIFLYKYLTCLFIIASLGNTVCRYIFFKILRLVSF